jgi:hypothetical protein
MAKQQGFSDETEAMLAEAGFEPCFVRDLYDGDQIAIRHDIDPEKPTEMTVTELFLPNIVSRTGYGDVQWIGVLPTGRKLHCSYSAKDPMWRHPSALDFTDPDDRQPKLIAFPREA